MKSVLGHVWCDFQSMTSKFPMDKEYIDPEAKFQELVLDERPGLKRLTFIRQARAQNLIASFKKLKYESNQTIFLLPSLLDGIEHFMTFPGVEPEQGIYVTEEQICDEESIASGKSLGTQLEIYAFRPRLAV